MGISSFLLEKGRAEKREREEKEKKREQNRKKNEVIKE